MNKYVYILCYWIIPAKMWLWLFEAEWFPVPKWAPPYILALGLGKKWGQFNVMERST